MFSHALVAYQAALMQFFTKTSETFTAASKTLSNEPHYNFCILKELTQANKEENIDEKIIEEISKPVDSDQMLFFQEEYKDEDTTKLSQESQKQSSLIDVAAQEEPVKSNTSKKIDIFDDKIDESTDLLGISNSEFGDFMSAKPLSFMPSQLLLNDLVSLDLTPESPKIESIGDSTKSKSSILDLFNNKSSATTTTSSPSPQSQPYKLNDKKSPKSNKDKLARKDMSAWFQLFAELDPLANPDAIAQKIEGNNSNHSHAA